MKRYLIFCIFLFSALASNAAELPSFTELVKSNKGAVVNISATTNASSQRFQAPAPEIFQHFFGDQIPFEFSMPTPKGQSRGSGFIISQDGYLLSNHHVVANADKIIVTLNDRREFVAKLIGADERSDIALLKIDGKKLPVVKFGNSEALEVGEWVLAIGSPFGFDYSVTSGIVSAKGRPLPNENYVPFIQTDAAINPGNSGGPLFNMKGEVVGINSQIYSRTGGFMGLSFAIPAEVALEVVEQLKKDGFVTRGWLGVLIQEVSHDLAESFGLSKPSGALIARVFPGSPAEEAGLNAGDVVVSLNGKSINSSVELPHIVGRAKVGEKIMLGVVRQGKKKQLALKVGALPDSNNKVARNMDKKAQNGSLGIVVRKLGSGERSRLGVAGGVVVVSVKSGAFAKAGVLAGDIITMLNNHPIESENDLQEVLENLKADSWIPLQIYRNGSPSFLPVYIAKK